uniref:Uncharacterized protein n=1 Tax=Lactuca sativa TaxID=4236 RepID=A0A9R1UVC2_LACSA|nr:hypothetical protein LSAT_V11C800440180 [Lactuca sativa]
MISGVPQHAWCEEAFSAIARNWGSVVIPDECQTDCPNMEFGRVGLLTSHKGLINTNIIIAVDNLPYQITIVEDIFESTRLRSFNEDVDDFGEYEVEADGDIDDIPIPAAPPELQAYSAERESTPETDVEESLPNINYPRYQTI